MNMLPNRRAQQQKNRLKSLMGPFSATSLSHLVDTAYCFFRRRAVGVALEEDVVDRGGPLTIGLGTGDADVLIFFSESFNGSDDKDVT
jgi:hypothetical protein